MNEELNDQNQNNNQDNQTQNNTTVDNTNSTNDTQNTADTSQTTEEKDSGVEVNPDIDSGEQVSFNSQMQQNTGSENIQMPSSASIPIGTSSQGQPLELNDGTSSDIARDSSLQYNAINTDGDASISFKSGNFNNISQLPQNINKKILLVTKTIMPLLEAALIELLGNSKSYKGEEFNAALNFTDNTPIINVNATYKIDNWIGTDIDRNDIAQDANYILNRLKVVQGVKWNECSIDCSSGIFKLSFVL